METLQRIRKLSWLFMLAFLLISCRTDSNATTIVEGNLPQGDDSSGIGGAQPQTELSATNPSRLDLESGRVTLIEFFAYW